MKKTHKQSGFTLVELLLAMTVFTFALILASASFVQINRLYLKSNTVAQTQSATRNVLEDVDRAIKLADNNIEYFSGSFAGFPGQLYCIGDVGYAFITDQVADLGFGQFSLVKGRFDSSVAGCNIPSFANLAIGGNTDTVDQMLNEDFIVREFRICAVGLDPSFTGDPCNLNEVNDPANGITVEAYQVSLTISHGDDDLFEGDTPDGANTVCDGGGGTAGSFCAVTRLETTVFRRVY